MKKFLLGVSLSLLLCSFAPAYAATVNVVVNDPDPFTITPGETFTVTVSNVGFPVTGGATLGVTWNPAVLDLLSLTPVSFDFLDPSVPEVVPGDGGFTQDQQDAGNIEFFTVFGFSDPVGDFDSFVLEFTAQSAGASPITIDETGASKGWNDPVANPITVDTYNQASVTVVSPVPVPASVWLFGSALGVLGWIRRRAA